MMATSNEELLRQDPSAVNIENTEGDERVIAMVSLRCASYVVSSCPLRRGGVGRYGIEE
jgi:hypothetical protein